MPVMALTRSISFFPPLPIPELSMVVSLRYWANWELVTSVADIQNVPTVTS